MSSGQKRFYVDALGMKFSDQVPGDIAFLRCTTDHHNLALARSERPGFHHGSFEVGGIDEIALGAEGMRERGWQPAWVLGRHAIGSNFFYYPRSLGQLRRVLLRHRLHPRGCALGGARLGRRLALYAWGPDVPADFIENKEA